MNVDAPVSVLDWSEGPHTNRRGSAPCRICGGETFLLDDDGLPAHKICVEAEQHLPSAQPAPWSPPVPTTTECGYLGCDRRAVILLVPKYGISLHRCIDHVDASEQAMLIGQPVGNFTVERKPIP